MSYSTGSSAFYHRGDWRVPYLRDHAENPFQVLVGTILSQRTRDENTDRASALLFASTLARERSRGPRTASLEKLIHSTGYYHTKARHIRATSQAILDRFDGKVPADRELLLTLPGVGPKTANCVLVFGYGTPGGAGGYPCPSDREPSRPGAYPDTGEDRVRDRPEGATAILDPAQPTVGSARSEHLPAESAALRSVPDTRGTALPGWPSGTGERRPEKRTAPLPSPEAGTNPGGQGPGASPVAERPNGYCPTRTRRHTDGRERVRPQVLPPGRIPSADLHVLRRRLLGAWRHGPVSRGAVHPVLLRRGVRL